MRGLRGAPVRMGRRSGSIQNKPGDGHLAKGSEKSLLVYSILMDSRRNTCRGIPNAEVKWGDVHPSRHPTSIGPF